MSRAEAIHKLLDAVYEENPVGGHAHIVVDDMNLEDHWIDECLGYPELSDAGWVCLTVLRALPFDSRFEVVIQYHNRVS